MQNFGKHKMKQLLVKLVSLLPLIIKFFYLPVVVQKRLVLLLKRMVFLLHAALSDQQLLDLFIVVLQNRLRACAPIRTHLVFMNLRVRAFRPRKVQAGLTVQ